jgi:hypothetical protein
MLLGTLVQTIALLFITLRTDWEKQVTIIIVCLPIYSSIFKILSLRNQVDRYLLGLIVMSH